MGVDLGAFWMLLDFLEFSTEKVGKIWKRVDFCEMVGPMGLDTCGFEIYSDFEMFEYVWFGELQAVEFYNASWYSKLFLWLPRVVRI